MTKTNFRIETGSSTDGVHVRITEDISGVTIASFRLTGAEAFDFLRGSTIQADGVISDNLDRIGKTMVNESVEVPAAEIQDVDYNKRTEAGERWARFNHPGWDVYDARRTNTAGVKVILRKWVEA